MGIRINGEDVVSIPLEGLSGLLPCAGRLYRIVIAWDGTRRIWVDGKEVFSRGAVIDADTDLLAGWETTYMLPANRIEEIT